jgi:DNA-directed RNA polymerase subunit M/transcription elongation factor TFIIS
MKFCDICDNMLYIKLDEDKKLMYFCKSCNNVVREDTDKSLCVFSNDYIEENNNYQQFINPDIKYDVTLPRVSNIKCTNPGCTKKADEGNEVIFIKYNSEKMKYLYMCCKCDTFWRS